MNNFSFKSPTFIKYGIAITNELPSLCSEFHMQHILFIIGKHVSKSDDFKILTDSMFTSSSQYEIFSDIPTEPTVSIVNHASRLIRDLKCDGIVSIGGGSVLDTAKAVSVLATNPGSASDYMFGGNGTLTNPALPVICIPTTAGSGSEVTASSVILDEDKKTKLSITHNFLFPKYALIDPLWHISMPHNVTVSTGMDALTHAIEAFTSTTANPVSDMYALKAISMIYENILLVSDDSADIEARGKMALASTLAALAFVNGGLGAVHGISQAMGGIAHVPHGIGNAILLPYVMDLNSKHSPDRFTKIAEAMKLTNLNENICNQTYESSVQNAEHVVKSIKELSNKLGIPTSTKAVGITPDMFPDIIKETMNYRLLHCNPAKITPEIVEDILRKSYDANF